MSQDQDASTYQAHLQAGNALVQQAQKIATQDFEQARAFWQAAGKEFYLAHKADMNEPEAAFRLAQAWMAEAHALQKEENKNALLMGQRRSAMRAWPLTWSPRMAASP